METNVGQKFSEGKLPLAKVLFSQFPLAIQEIARASNAGHRKYLGHGDEDWQNFSRVPGGSQNYKDAALRHLLEAENQEFNEDMAEYGKIRHLSQFCWNALAALEIHMRSEVFKETNKSSVPPPNRAIYSEPIEEYPKVGSDIPEEWLQEENSNLDEFNNRFQDTFERKLKTNLNEWMAKHKVENELKGVTWEEKIMEAYRKESMKPPPFPDFSKGCVRTDTAQKQHDTMYPKERLSVDQLTSQEKHEDYYPDQEIN